MYWLKLKEVEITSTHILEWLKFKTQKMQHVDITQTKLEYIAGKNVK